LAVANGNLDIQGILCVTGDIETIEFYSILSPSAKADGEWDN